MKTTSRESRSSLATMMGALAVPGGGEGRPCRPRRAAAHHRRSAQGRGRREAGPFHQHQLTIAKLPLAKDLPDFDFAGSSINDGLRLGLRDRLAEHQENQRTARERFHHGEQDQSGASDEFSRLYR